MPFWGNPFKRRPSSLGTDDKLLRADPEDSKGQRRKDKTK